MGQKGSARTYLGLMASPRTLVVLVIMLTSGATHAGKPFTCAARLEAARVELLRAGFNPARSTEGWLTVQGLWHGGVELSIYTVYSPDGDGRRFFEAELRPWRRQQTQPWRSYQRLVLDEFEQERLPERTWTRARAGWLARIHTRTEDRALVTLFERIVRPALEDCLARPGAVGKLERCRYDGHRWICKRW